jgi:leucine dehydrogenase
MMRAFGQFLEGLGGRYITTEDVGSSPEDLVAISQATSHVVGLPRTLGGSGDPSKATGFGIYRGMKVAARQALGTDSLKDLSIAIQGFGKVAGYLTNHLLVEGARLTVTDINPDALDRARALGCTIVENPDAIYDVPSDIFAPCALGGSINSDTTPRLQCKIVAGSANNQLLTPEDGETLWKKGVLYVPDYVLNAGGVINLSYEIGRPYQEEEAMERVAGIADSVEKVMSISKDEDISPAKAADWLAEMRIKSVRRAKGIYLER